MATNNTITPMPTIQQPIADKDGLVDKTWFNYLTSLSGMATLQGNGAPTSAPNKIGYEYLDLAARKLYKAFGVSAVSDWVLIN